MLENDEARSGPSRLSIWACADESLRLCFHGQWRMPLLSVIQQALPYLGIANIGWGACAPEHRCSDASPNGYCNVCRSLIVDLTQATYLDSTIFGMIAGIGQRYAESMQRFPVLRICEGYVLETIKALSFDQLFSVEQAVCTVAGAQGCIVAANGDDNEWPAIESRSRCLFDWSSEAANVKNLPASALAETSLGVGRTVVEAHKVLSQLSEENRQAFCPLIEGLSGELTEVNVECERE